MRSNITYKVTDDKYHKYLQSAKWKKLRTAIINRRKKCELCGKKKDLHVHHLTYKILYRESFPGNSRYLMLVCKKCHYKIHNSRLKKYKKLDPKRSAYRKSAIFKFHDRFRSKAFFFGRWWRWFIF